MHLRLLLEQDGPQDAKAGADGEKFRMSERQRVRGTAVDSCFCESRGNLVSNTVMPPFIQRRLGLKPFRVFRVFRGSLATSLECIIQLRKSYNAAIANPGQLASRPGFYFIFQLFLSVPSEDIGCQAFLGYFQRRPDAMPSMVHPVLGTSRSVRHIQRRR